MVVPDTPVLAMVGRAAAFLALLDPVPYVRDVLRGRTRPQRVTWFIWSVLAIVTFCAQVGDGATWSVAMAGAQAVSTLVVFVLSNRHGQGGTGRTDVRPLLGHEKPR